MKLIPIYVAAGINSFESPASEYQELSLSLDEILVLHPSATFIFRAKNTCLEGVGIFDNDILLADSSLDVRNYDVVVALFNEMTTVSIYDAAHHQILTTSSKHAPIKITEFDQYQTEGVVFASIRLHRENLDIPQTNYNQIGLHLDQLLIKNFSASFIGVAKGSSMEGVGIFDNDLLLVDRSLDARNNDLVVAIYNGSFVVKIYDEKNAQLISASNNYKPVKINKYDRFIIEGVVTSSIRLHRAIRELTCLV